VKVGITTFCLDRTVHPVRMAREVEGRGFESLWYPEHSHIPVSRRSPWPGSARGEPLPDDYRRMHDQFNALAMAGAVTTSLKLGTSVTLLGQRDPIWTAKQIASLDHLTDGRVLVGVGFGWNREEQENHGYPWADRRAMVREKVLAMRALWTEDEAGFDGEHVRFERSWALPKPVQQPGPPIYLGGGTGPKLFAAIAEWADGWMPITARPSIADRLAPLRAAWERAGRDPAKLAVTVFGATTDADGLATLAAEGVTRVALTLPYEGVDVVLPLLDEWAPLAARFNEER
jgi:probable F420-dependent oxidoreductase